MLRTFTLLILSFICHNVFAEPAEWHMVNVNNNPQGDAHLLIDNGKHTLIDAGDAKQSTKYLIPYMRNFGVNTVHHLFVSHPHKDHYGGIESLLDAKIEIKKIYYSLPPEGLDDAKYNRADFLSVLRKAKQEGVILQQVSKGFSLDLPSTTLKILHANKMTTLNGRRVSINDYSLILRWDAGGFRSLFTGDLGANVGGELAKQAQFKADILKVPHHGVTKIAPDAFFNAVSPSVNMFPSSRVLWSNPRIEQSKSWTLSSGIYYCNNGLNGNIVLSFSDNVVSVKSDKPSSACPNGALNITPGPKINESRVTSIIPFLLNLE